jgi:PAS domain S-box-containing protein
LGNHQCSAAGKRQEVNLRPLLRILSLEDDPRDAELIQGSLEAEGIACEVIRVDTQPAFQASLEKDRFDLILADYTLPSFDGLSALKLARSICPDVPFIFVTGTLGEEVAIEALKIGATDYILKTRLSRLAPSVRRALREADDRGERKRAEEALRRNEAYLIEAQTLSHTGSFGWNVSSGEIYWSEETCKIFEHDPSLKPTLELVFQRTHPDDRDLVKQKIDRATRERTAFDLEHRLLMADGSLKYIHVLARAVEAFPGNLEFVGAVTDISERKRAEEALRASENNLRRIVDAVPGLQCSMSSSGKVELANRQLLEYFGKTIEELDRWSTNDLVHPDDLHRAIDYFTSSMASGTPLNHELRCRRADGVYRWSQASIFPVRDADGKITGWYCLITDIEDRKRAEEVLRESEAYLAEAQRLSHTGSWALSPATGEFRYWSDETFRLMGFDPAGGTPPFETVAQRFHPDDQPIIEAKLERATRERAEFEVDYRIIHPGGEIRDIHAVGHPVLGRSGDLVEFVGSVIDVTERKRAEEALRSSEAYLAEGQRLSHTGTWACNIATREMIHSSQEHRHLFGLAPEKAGIPSFEEFFKRIHPDDQVPTAGDLDRAISAGRDVEAYFRVVLPEGSTRHMYGVGRPLVKPSGATGEFVGAVMDVTERKQAEDKIRQSEMELRQIVDFAPQHVGVLGPDRERLYLNQASLEYIGLTLEEWQSGDNRRSVHPDDWERMMSEAHSNFLRGIPHEAELRLRRRDGTYRWFFFRYNPLRDEQGRLRRWYVAGIDIEDRKQAEQRLHDENVALREEIDRASMYEEIVGTSPALHAVLSLVSKVAPTDSTVLITGETGTGKELIARAVHRRSQRSSRAFISVNCAAIPRDLIASELFGHEKGAFTGAIQRRLGRFELAEGGTIFLDEIGELPAETQIALLRVLQEREFERVGGTGSIQTNVRVIAATNRDLQEAIARSTFRSDLFYRLNVFPIEVPALRERREDIPMLVAYFIDRYARKSGKTIRSIDKKSLEVLQSYPWPGNIRELQNVIERSAIVCDTENFSVDESWLSRQPASEPKSEPKSQPELSRRLASREKEMIESALRESGGRVSGPSGAAIRLGIPGSTLDSKIRALKIDKNRFKSPFPPTDRN